MVLSGLPEINDLVCENLCEKNFPKSAKIGKVNSNDFSKLSYLRRLETSEVMTENPSVRSSILRLGTIKKLII